ncbi:MAG: TAXI family TRAP transporter solute-binding subunit [Pseudomonadales bacterium]|jgi:TRAP transporter TAXI family solute receptor|nr:TAXI family TRAP transporter solute-binding subunit [Pseudomonadales bacterium]
MVTPNLVRRVRAARVLILPVLLLLAASAAVAELPRTMTWSAYNLGTTGYNQAVGIGAMLRQRYGVTLRVIPGKNDISRLLPLRRGLVQFSANGVATFFAQEGLHQFAAKDWGPLPIRLVAMSNGLSNQALAVAADTGITRFSELRGRRVAWVRGAPSLNVSTEAFLACGGLTWNDVERVEFPGYDAMWNGIVAGQVDAAYATTVSGPTRKLEASPRGISWPPAPHDDARCWEGIRAVAPYFTQHVATRGAGISDQSPHEGGTYPYPLLMTFANQDAGVVRSLAEAIDLHFEDFRDSDPGALGWARDRQIFDWVVPYHEAAVDYWRSVGVWTDAHEAHNAMLLRRQAVLADAWQAHVTRWTGDDDGFQAAWLAERARRLAEAELEILAVGTSGP